MVPTLDRDTTLCISLAARPSQHGVRFHNWLYSRLGLNYAYHAIAPEDIVAAVAGIRGLGIRGAGISMPYKQQVIPLLDALDDSAHRLTSVNTIVNDDGHLIGYNTDYLAVASLVRESGIDPAQPVALRGSGGMASAVATALADLGFRGTIVARNHHTGTRLATRLGWDHATEVPTGASFLVNVTPLGMSGPDEEIQAFNDAELARAQAVCDAVAMPVDTPLIRRARALGLPLIHGGDIIALQAAEQFTLYTGVTPTPAQVREAEQYAQESR
ncbi:shikimate 5-dehydrogenase [Corynebacterium sp. zg-331]|uniref:shikimate 5-dehydrogenase n=1 Tax=unclassified Corynebacterium TaxID=2624378 RepID=UPI00128B2D8C|nr:MULTISPECIES: shikimate 5-dehydrogenase [unclassified Corynebacterium]MBC3186165.1 shikimate 5-dehydrogenase [Corynebacterium sp. zg-331]MPV52654.1 shikimate 5-dehydrogenase [Corynebacterium sp. zg331]